MERQRDSYEMADNGRNASVRVQKDQYSVPASIDSQVRIRQLFSFSQIFMFSLTYMGLWEGMCT